MTWGIKKIALDALLVICRLFEWGMSLPKTCRTLLKTPRKVTNIKSVPPGEHYHFGILKGIESVFRFSSDDAIPDVIEIFVNVDGIPISKSSGNQFWPILGMVGNAKNRKVFLIGIFYGTSKPDLLEDYLADFVAEAESLRQNGITLKGRQHGFRLKAFVCDTPARSYILNINGHTAYFGC